jgi:hypothetical protein
MGNKFKVLQRISKFNEINRDSWAMIWVKRNSLFIFYVDKTYNCIFLEIMWIKNIN